MFTTTSEYLKPLHELATFCGCFPHSIPPHSASHRCYCVYSLVLLLFSAASHAVVSVEHYNYYNDIVCFTFLLTDVITFAAQISSLVIPATLRKTYLKLLRRLEGAENLIHTLNINQKEKTARTLLYTLVGLGFSMILFHKYILYFEYRASVFIGIGLSIGYVTYVICYIHILLLSFIIKNKLDSINWYLAYLNNKVPVYLTAHDAKMFLQNKLYGENVERRFVSCDEDVRRVTAHKIKTFNQIHFLLYSSCNLVSKYFSFQILVFILTTALQGIVTFIVLFDTMVFPPSTYAVLVTFVVYNCVLLVCVTDTFHKIKSEVRNRAKPIRKAKSKYEYKCIISEPMLFNCYSRRGRHFWSATC